MFTAPVIINLCLKRTKTPTYTENEGPVRIQYKCLVTIYVFPEMKLAWPRYFQNRIIMFYISTFMYL